MRTDKDKAMKLRRLGKSYLEIKSQLGIPKSTLSEWFADQKWSNKIASELSIKSKESSTIRIRKLNSIRGENLKKIYLEAEREAKEEFEVLKYHPLFVSALMIYWGEGDKVSKNRCTIANTEPQMIKIYLDFLKYLCGAELPRIKGWILIYPDLNESTCREFWMRNIGLKQVNFNKTIMIQGKHKTNKLQYGVFNLGYSSTYLKVKIIKWIQLLAEDIIARNYIK